MAREFGAGFGLAAAGLGDDAGDALGHDVGVGEAGADGVDGDAACRDLLRERPGQADQRVLEAT